MFQQVIVPVDGSRRSWAAARVGAVIADACDARLELVSVVFDEHERDFVRNEVRADLAVEGPLEVEPSVTVIVAAPPEGSVGAVVARHAESVDGGVVVMSSTGRGRTAAMLGSVADDVLRAMFGPIIVVGPHAEPLESLAGDLMVPVDGSEFSETSLPLAASWGIALGATPWIVEVLTERMDPGTDVLESSYAHRLARDLQTQSHHDVEFDVLHGADPATAIAEFADRNGAMFVVMSTHGRSGLRRLTLGSTAASVVHRATCPVVLHRPPRFRLTGAD